MGLKQWDETDQRHTTVHRGSTQSEMVYKLDMVLTLLDRNGPNTALCKLDI